MDKARFGEVVADHAPVSAGTGGRERIPMRMNDRMLEPSRLTPIIDGPKFYNLSNI
jgi:hypothetical protein